MNKELRKLAEEVGLTNEDMESVCLDFCFACARRIHHLLESEETITAYKDFEKYINGHLDKNEFVKLQTQVLELANKHPGSTSLDGTKHSAVSATYALANAINKKPIEAAEYAAYAKTYGYGGYAVNDLDSYQEEYTEQIKILKDLLTKV